MQALRRLRDLLSSWCADYLSRPIKGFEAPAACSLDQLAALLQPGDVLLVEGNLRIEPRKPLQQDPGNRGEYTQPKRDGEAA